MSITRVDVHHHLLTSEYLEELAKVGVVGSGGLPFPHWTPEETLGFLDRAQIQAAVLSLSSPGLCFGNAAKEREIARALNEFAAESVTRWPQRLGFFATLPLPDVEAALAEIAYALDTLHADGIGLLSNYQGIYPGDARFDPIFAELDRRQAVAFLHPTVFTGSEIPSTKNAGSPVPTIPTFMLEFVFDTTRAVANLVISGTLTKYPRLRIILSHAGGTLPFVAQRIVSGAIIASVRPQGDLGQLTLPREQIAALRQELADNILGQLSSLYFDTALSTNSNAFSSLRHLVPVSHILLGTDYPFASEIEAGSTVTKLATLPDLNKQELEEIEGINASKLFPRLSSLPPRPKRTRN
ncbi:MAG TPA: amidohydrolase family protein [Ktedonobacteraceae bacterium]